MGQTVLGIFRKQKCPHVSFKSFSNQKAIKEFIFLRGEVDCTEPKAEAVCNKVRFELTFHIKQKKVFFSGWHQRLSYAESNTQQED